MVNFGRGDSGSSDITIPQGGQLIVRNSQGFPVFSIDENGNIVHMGSIKRSNAI